MQGFISGNIITLCSSNIYGRGFNYYENDHVLSVEVIDKDNRLTHIRSMVQSSSFSEYLVKICVGENNFLREFYCTCEDYEKRKKVCPHIVASYLKYINDVYKEESTIDKLIGEYKGLKIITGGKRQLKLEIKLNCNPKDRITNSLEFRVGEDKTFVVKEMREFLSSFEKKEALQFGKTFIMDFDVHYFSEEDEALLEFLCEGLDMYTDSIIKGKKVFVLDRAVPRLMELLKDREFEMAMAQEEGIMVKIEEEDYDIDFLLKSNGEELQLLFKDADIPFPITLRGAYFLHKGKLIKLPDNKMRIFLPIYKEIISTNNGVLIIKGEDRSKFASFILPRLNVLGRVYMDESLMREFYQEDLKTILYLDREKDKVIIYPYFNYGERKINPWLHHKEEDNKDGILVRDIEGEERVIALIKDLGFKDNRKEYFIEDEDTLIDLLSYGIEKLQEIGEVYYSESFKNTKVYGGASYKSSIRLNNEDMLEFSFDINGLSRNELADVFKALRNKKKYYKLKDNSIVLLNTNEMSKLYDVVEALDIDEEDLANGEVKLPKYFSMYLDEKFKEETTKNAMFRELINNLNKSDEIEYALPSGLNGTLRSYQVKGFKWLKAISSYGFGGILADEMGLGKTIQTISLLLSEKDFGTSIIVCPTSLLYNWKEEIDKFAPDLKTLVLWGSKDDRKELFENIDKYDVIITSYPLVRRDLENYKDIDFNYIILDEAQQIKNPRSQNAEGVKSLKGRRRFALTGTPIENSLTELWSIFDFIMPGYLGGHNRFIVKYETPVSKYKDKWAAEELKRRVLPFILRRLKKDVIKELPPKIEHNIVVEMTEEQKKLYASYVSAYKEELDATIREKGLNGAKIKILSALTRLRQICCDPSTFVQGYDGESGKMKALYEVLENSIDEGHKILVFSQFTSVLKNISRDLNKMGVDHSYLDGSVPSFMRMEMVKDFNKGDKKVFLISLKAGGSGLNLTSADIVIHFDPWWNPAVEDQATDRAHRIGQKNRVEVIKLVAKGSIEEKILKLQKAKKEIIKSVMGDEEIGENILSSMTREDLEELFKI